MEDSPKVLFWLHIELRLDAAELAMSLSRYGSIRNKDCLALIKEMGGIITFSEERLTGHWGVSEDGKLLRWQESMPESKVGIITVTYDNFCRLRCLQSYVEKDEILSIGLGPVIKFGDGIDTIYWSGCGGEGSFYLSHVQNDWASKQKAEQHPARA